MSKNLLLAILFIIGVVLVIYGQKHIGYSGLAFQLLGLVMLLGLLWNYNRKYQ